MDHRRRFNHKARSNQNEEIITTATLATRTTPYSTPSKKRSKKTPSRIDSPPRPFFFFSLEVLVDDLVASRIPRVLFGVLCFAISPLVRSVRLLPPLTPPSFPASSPPRASKLSPGPRRASGCGDRGLRAARGGQGLRPNACDVFAHRISFVLDEVVIAPASQEWLFGDWAGLRCEISRCPFAYRVRARKLP